MKYTIFYSWQSDLPNNTNRGFIESVINKAIGKIISSESYELEPSIDRDTQGEPGAPNISQTILKKIKECDAFVADVSIVTACKSEGKRPSCNPNVLIELGFAIALLGWEKIILFCNEAHGKDEDLPFDIRQHRRIGYHLLQDDIKTDVKKNLISQFSGRLKELLENGKTNQNSLLKKPEIAGCWNYWTFGEKKPSTDGVDDEMIVLQRISDISNLKNNAKQELEKIKDIDGSFDPKWPEKVQKFVDEIGFYIKELDSGQNVNDLLFDSNFDKALPLTLTIENIGNAAATDIRVSVPLPDWLLSFEKLPSRKDIPKKLKIPIPTMPKPVDVLASFGKVGAFGNAFNSDNYSPILPTIHLTSACNLKDRVITFWADRLLHKHRITNKSDRFYLLAMPNAPVGENKIQGKAFCSEYDDWQQLDMIVKIV